MCPGHFNDIRASIEFYIKDNHINRTFYKENSSILPDNSIITEKYIKFQDLAKKLDLNIGVRINRYLLPDEIISIFINQQSDKLLTYKKEISDYLQKLLYFKTKKLIDNVQNIDDANKLFEKYNRKLSVLITILSYDLLYPYFPLNTNEKKTVINRIEDMESELYKMNINHLSTSKLSLIVLSHIKSIVFIMNRMRDKPGIFKICNDNITILCDKLKQHS